MEVPWWLPRGASDEASHRRARVEIATERPTSRCVTDEKQGPILPADWERSLRPWCACHGPGEVHRLPPPLIDLVPRVVHYPWHLYAAECRAGFFSRDWGSR
jgi:hypothetical protein